MGRPALHISRCRHELVVRRPLRRHAHLWLYLSNGFFNFYLSLGLCMWYLAICWGRSWRIHALAAPLLLLAWIAHPFPVLWATGTALYSMLASRLQPRRRSLLLMLGLILLVAARSILIHRYPHTWSLAQLTFITGANQVALFGVKYVAPLAGLLLIWAVLFHHLIKRQGIPDLVSSIPFQLWLLNAAAVVLIPDRLLFPQFGRPLGFIAERLSLTAGLMICTVLAAAPSLRLARVGLVAVAVLFFGLLYTDDRELNHKEDQLDAALSGLPSGQRVIGSLPDQSLRALCFHHDLDRACIGQCFSYANYEPSSRQFRIRARPENGIVLTDYADVDQVARGTYIVLPRDLPLYLVYPCGMNSNDVCSRPLRVGETSGTSK
jgi:hypothetical protein